LDFDFAHQTSNGLLTTGGAKESHWWAFRSICTPTQCVATGAQLEDDNQLEPTGAPHVLKFINGRWQDTPYLGVPAPCPSGSGTQNGTVSWSLEPQTDGTLRGVLTTTVLSKCAGQGSVYKTPVVGTRTGDVPRAVVLADPALFLT
jgi:hypothetical protein